MNRKHRIRGVSIMPYVLIAPTCLLIIGLVLYPILRVFGYSTMTYISAYNMEPVFVGLDNFIEIFTEDRLFGKVLLNSLKWVVCEVGFQFLFGCIMALILNQSFRGRSVARAISLIPWAVSGVLTAILWQLIFNEHIGCLNDILLKLGVISKKLSWLGDFKLVFPSVVVADLWRGIPFFTISLLAALQNISPDLYEAARIDGASYWKQLIYITLPSIKDTILLTTLLRIVWEFNSVDVIYNLTAGGPANKTMTLSMYITNEAIKGGNYGYGSALSIVSFCILTVFAILYLKFGHFADQE